MDDDFEIEVSDLRTGKVLKTARDMPEPAIAPAMMPGNAPATTSVAASGAGDSDFELEVSDLFAPGRPAAPNAPLAPLPSRAPRPSRRQLIGAGASGALVLIVLFGLLGGVVGKGGFTLGLFPTPVPTATLADGADTFYMVNAVPWGRLRADGKDLSVTFSVQSVTFFNLSLGRHTIQYDAPPFPSLRCSVSVPAASSDTCPLYTLPSDSNQPIRDTNRGIDFGDTLSRLSPNDYQALVTLVSRSLAAPVATATVPAGGRYQGANGKVLVAATPLKAQAFYTLNTDPNTGIFGESCAGLCDIPFENGSPTGDSGWNIVATITPIWRYTDSSGTTVQLPATPQLPNSNVIQSGQPGLSMSTFFAVTWTGAWQVVAQQSFGGQDGCFNADGIVNELPSFGNWRNGGYSSSEMPAPNPADGCLLTFQASDGQGNVTGKPLWYLYRFGLLLTANDEAHRVSPELPVAVGGEATLARQLAKLLAQQQHG